MSTPASFRSFRSSATFGFLAAAAGSFLVASCSGDPETCTGTACTDVSPSGSTTSTATSSSTSSSSATTTTTAHSSTSSAGTTGSQVGPTGTSGPSGTSTGPSGTSTGQSGTSGSSGTVGPSSSTAPTSTGTTSTSGSAGSSGGDDTSTSGGGETSDDPGPAGEPNPSGLPEPGDGGVARPAGTAGGLTVIPWAGFAGALSYTFDDATTSQHDNKDAMLDLDVPFTWYLANAGGDPKHAMYHDALELGHELGNHTLNHNANESDAQAGQGFLMDEYGVVGYTLAAPNGTTSGLVNITNQTFLLDRGVSGGTIGADGNTDWTNLPSAIPNEGASNFNGYADTAAGGKWQTVCIHGFQRNGAKYDTSYQPVNFDAWRDGVEYAKTKNVWVTSMVNVAAYLIGGKAVSSATPAADGGGQKWTWTLKDTFPPGHYVRVTVDGGTLSQGGTALPWNEHGYYEVALDEGELTLAP